MRKIVMFLIAAIMMIAVSTANAGQAVYYEGSSWDAFSGQAVLFSSGTYYTSDAHAVYHDTIYGVYIKCTTVTAGRVALAYQLSPTATSTDFVYPSGISWVTDSVTSTTPQYINFEPEVRTKYVRFQLWPITGDASAACTVKLYEQ